MDIHELWERALKYTEIIRARVQGLATFSDTQIPYILLSESTMNLGDTVVRKGEVLVQKPSLILPPHTPQFQGFDFEGETPFRQESLVNFLLIRGITLPSLKYNHKTYSLDVQEKKLQDTIEYFTDQLQKTEDVHTGLVAGPEDCWQFSVLIFVCSQILRNADNDIKKLLDEYKKRNK